MLRRRSKVDGGGGGSRTLSGSDSTLLIDSTKRQSRQKRRKRQFEVHGGYTDGESKGVFLAKGTGAEPRLFASVLLNFDFQTEVFYSSALRCPGQQAAGCTARKQGVSKDFLRLLPQLRSVRRSLRGDAFLA